MPTLVGLSGVVGLVAAGWLALSAAQGPGARAPVERFLTRRLGRTVTIAGGLRLRLLQATPEADFYDLRLGEPAWAGTGDMARVAHLYVRMPWSALTGGRLRFEALDLERPVVRLLRNRQGRANWTFSSGTRQGSPLQLPPIARLSIRDGRLSLDDQPREVATAGPVYTEAVGPARGTIRMRMGGTMKGKPFRLAIDGDPVSGLNADSPYAISGEARAGTTVLRVRVRLARAFDFGRVTGEARSSGDTLHGLADIVGVPLPNTPRYALSVRLRRDGSHYAFEALRGRVGASDVHGALRLDMADGRRRLTGALRSERLRLGDLLSVLGGESGAPEAVAARRAARARGPGTLLPDGAMKASWFRALDARVGFSAGRVESGRLPLRRLSFVAGLRRGVLDVRPLSLQFARGRFDGGVQLDFRSDLPGGRLAGRFGGFRAEDVLGLLRAPDTLAGPLDGSVRLAGRGPSLHRMAAASQGGAALVLGPGQVRRVYAQMLGGDVAGGLLHLEDRGGAVERCAAIGLVAKSGHATVQVLTIDTDLAVIDGTGDGDLGSETLTLRLTGRSKRPQILRAVAPATIAGPWRKPKVSVNRGGLIRSGAAGLFSTALSPLKALVPALGPKPAADVDCRALAARAQAAVSAPGSPADRGRPG